MGKAEGKPIYLFEVEAGETPPLFAYEPDAFDMNHATNLLGATRKTVQREIDRGKLRSFHVVTRVRLTKQALVDYVLEGDGGMRERTKAPTVLVFWREQRTTDVVGAATNAPQVKHIILFCMVAARHEVGGVAA